MLKQHLPEPINSDNDNTHLWRMRWFFLIVFALAFLASITVVIVTKNSLTLSIPGSLLLAMRPIIRWLFPQRRSEQDDKKQGP